jgi:polyhydroxybutyrate depolymerase
MSQERYTNSDQDSVTIQLISKKREWLILFVLPFLISCSNRRDIQTLIHDGITREYVLIVPESYDGNSRMPLMLGFHGYGQRATDFLDYSGMRGVAEAENFILVCPQGTLLNGNPHWNPSMDSPDNKSDADDFGFIEVLIDELLSSYKIDPERIYAYGISNGAFFTYALACYHSDRIAAIGSVVGTMFDDTYMNCKAIHPTAMINIHGTSDQIVPYDGNEAGLLPIGKVLDYWISFNNTDTIPKVYNYENRGTGIEHYVYSDGSGGVSVEHYKVIGGRHKWLDINIEGANISRIIWEFVSKYDINGLREDLD